ncbi:MAG: FUSC family protein [Actinobacteria bacterium]|nr:FUSC family protein [Actinomycetota bacterium]
MLRAAWAQLLQTAIAAGLAWYVAHDLIGHRSPFFAPIAAVIALGVVPGNHTRRAVEIVLGVGVGIAMGDLLISGIGRGPGQLTLIVLLAMVASVLLGGSALVVAQAASSAVLVATLSASTHGLVPTRFVDAFVGGAVGLAVLAVVPRDAAKILQRAAAPVFSELAAILEDIADALDRRDVDAANAALARARATDDLVYGFEQTVLLATETVRLSPLQRRERGRVERYATAGTQVGFAIRNARVLARAALRAVELEPSVPASLVESVRTIARAARLFDAELDSGDGAARIGELLRRAAAQATHSYDEQMGFAVAVLVGQVRSIATDLLRAAGVGQREAVRELRAAAAQKPGATLRP